ncbi:helix-turn-helix domain-containing protein [Streptomyces sp. NPDC051561]|uniref:helix-turn-helix domain-containing protein n=1 Tax=Streptomyces sp. NPDC051561 TaxID=3365658 RepID=UPI0037890234
MPPRSAPTARQLRLGVELRKLRERAGLTARQAGELLGGGQALASNIETGRFGLSEQRIRALTANYGCTDEALIAALVSMTGKRNPGWWEKYRNELPVGQLDLAEAEHHATTLHMASTVHVLGLLQTVDYARALIRGAIPPPTPPELEHRVSYRIKRQQVLYREHPVPFRGILHEAALRMRFGGRETMAAQLRHLVELARKEHITLRVIPFAAEVLPGSGQTISYFTGPVRQLDTAQLDQSHGTLLLHEEAQLTRYRQILAVMESAALSPEDSSDFIARIAKEHEAK